MKRQEYLLKRLPTRMRAAAFVFIASSFCSVLCFETSVDPALAQGASPNKQGWKFEQKSSTEGAFTMLVGDVGIKFTCPKQNLIAILDRSGSKVWFLNSKSKLGMEFELERWKVGGYHINEKMNSNYSTGEVPEEWKGMKAARRNRKIVLEPLKGQYEMLYRGGSDRAKAPSTEDLLFERFTKLSANQKSFLCGLYRMPAVSGLMLKRVELYDDGKKDEVLSTQSVAQVKLTDSAFQPSFTYRKVKERDEVTMENRNRKDAAGVFQDLFTENGKPAAEGAKAKAELH